MVIYSKIKVQHNKTIFVAWYRKLQINTICVSGLSLFSNKMEKLLLFQKAHREKLKTTERNGETYEKLIVINPNIVSQPVADVVVIIR